MDFLTFLTGSVVWPHTLALAILFILGIIESACFLLAGMGLGDVLSAGHVDHDIPEATHLNEGLSDIKSTEGLPLSINIMLALMGFGLSGIIFQYLFSGSSLSLSLLIGMGGAFLSLKGLGSKLAKVLPKDETYALTERFLQGQSATVVLGVASNGNPSQARVKDWHGREILIMVEPGIEFEPIKQGESCSLLTFDKKRGVWFVSGKPKQDVILK